MSSGAVPKGGSTRRAFSSSDPAVEISLGSIVNRLGDRGRTLRLRAGRFQMEEGTRLWSPLRPAMCLRDGVSAHGTPEIVSDRVPVSGKGFRVGPVLYR